MRRLRLPQSFARGDRVRLRDSGLTGTVAATGEQQTEVRLDAGYSQCFPNHWLERLQKE
jgi:preprotein translocase subunit YajC